MDLSSENLTFVESDIIYFLDFKLNLALLKTLPEYNSDPVGFRNKVFLRFYQIQVGKGIFDEEIATIDLKVLAKRIINNCPPYKLSCFDELYLILLKRNGTFSPYSNHVLLDEGYKEVEDYNESDAERE